MQRRLLVLDVLGEQRRARKEIVFPKMRRGRNPRFRAEIRKTGLGGPWSLPARIGLFDYFSILSMRQHLACTSLALHLSAALLTLACWSIDNTSTRLQRHTLLRFLACLPPLRLSANGGGGISWLWLEAFRSRSRSRYVSSTEVPISCFSIAKCILPGEVGKRYCFLDEE